MDMLIKLYELPSLESAASPLASSGIEVRRAMAYERRRIIAWVESQFNTMWADECCVAFGRQPIGCLVAQSREGVVGFCCLHSTYRNFIGPVGIAEKWRSLGIGRYLVLSALWQMRFDGYAYAVVGDVGQPDFFKRIANAVGIAGSTPGPYASKAMD